ncbi:MAG: Asp-tRNA(Asn)/Glu-tRNA(Gln) amidotransferase subunit GatA [Longimicrobiales bacterium]
MKAASVAEIAAAILARQTSALEVTDAALARLEHQETGPNRLNAFLSWNAERARAAAARIDRVPHGRLDGVPIAVKDNICTLEYPTTCGSRILEHYQSPFDATVVRRLKSAGAVIIGKTNLDEFAMGSSTEHSAFGPTLNPHDRTRVPGGSSGGSAAAVAAGIVPAALGSETGGSVRQPAAFCGIVGIKPSYGRVSRYGLVAFASSLDQVGTFGRTVADASLLLETISGHDPLDSTSAPRAVPDLTDALRGELEGLVVGVPAEYFPSALDPGIRALCNRALDRLADAGARIRDVSLPHSAYSIPTYYVIAPAEASANLARYDGVRYGARAAFSQSTIDVYEQTRSLGFGAEVKRRIMLGTYALSAGYYDQYYGQAQRVRALITRDFRRVFDSGVDVLFTPTAPTLAFRLGEKSADPYEMYLSDIFTVTANLAAVPAISMPIGTLDGLPAGGQFIADRWNELTMIRAAAGLERLLS